MYGYRARFGVVVPSINTVCEPEFYEVLPEGVSAYTSRVQLADVSEENLREAMEEVIRSAKLLGTIDLDAIAYAGTTETLVEGRSKAVELEEELSDVTGASSMTTSLAIDRALDAMGIGSVTVVTPFSGEIDDLIGEFLEECGYSVSGFHGRVVDDGASIGNLPPAEVYRQAKGEHPDADAILIACTNYRTLGIVKHLERDAGMPVVTSNQATLWNVLQRCDVTPDADLPGDLFEFSL